VRHVQEACGVSERRACAVLGQPRASQRYLVRTREEAKRLVARMHELVREHPRYGYRRIWALLRREGWRVNRKRVHRLWRKEGLKVPKKQRKRRRLGSGQNACSRRRAEHPDHVWAWDFIHDRTEDGRPLKWLSIVDEYTRECVAFVVDRSLTSEAVLDVLAERFRTRGVPRHIRSDNGPEFIAQAIREWLGRVGVATLYVEPGSPWENGYAESFHSRLRDELLEREAFGGLAEAKAHTERWRREYNHHRPHSSLGYLTPAEFAAGWAASAPAAPALQQPSPPPVLSPFSQPALS
jgi:transposase InsO family protein